VIDGIAGAPALSSPNAFVNRRGFLQWASAARRDAIRQYEKRGCGIPRQQTELSNAHCWRLHWVTTGWRMPGRIKRCDSQGLSEKNVRRAGGAGRQSCSKTGDFKSGSITELESVVQHRRPANPDAPLSTWGGHWLATNQTQRARYHFHRSGPLCARATMPAPVGARRDRARCRRIRQGQS